LCVIACWLRCPSRGGAVRERPLPSLRLEAGCVVHSPYGAAMPAIPTAYPLGNGWLGGHLEAVRPSLEAMIAHAISDGDAQVGLTGPLGVLL
jgi:hypothetical protein